MPTKLMRWTSKDLSVLAPNDAHNVHQAHRQIDSEAAKDTA